MASLLGVYLSIWIHPVAPLPRDVLATPVWTENSIANLNGHTWTDYSYIYTFKTIQRKQVFQV